MKIPLVDLSKQYAELGGEIDAALKGACERSQFILGPAVEKFEAGFAEFNGVNHCAAVNSGTSAIHLALLAAGIGPGDEVICPTWTFIATIEAVLYAGAKPVLTDCDERTFCMTPELFEEAITPATKAVIPVHIYGYPCRMEEIVQIANKHGIAVIEDAAQSHGASYAGKMTGSFGKAGCFSFYPSKNLGAFGEGGAIVSDDADFIAKVKRLRSHGESERYVHAELGFNMRMSGFQGAILGVKLPHLAEWNEKRRQAGSAYRKALAGTELIFPPEDGEKERQVYHLFVVRSPKRDALREFLTEKGVGTAIHYLKPTHKQPMWTAMFGEQKPLPVSEKLAGEILSLPMYPELTGDQINYIAECVREFHA